MFEFGMKDQFYKISEWDMLIYYLVILLKKKVKRINEFLSFKFFDRCGGRIGVTRMIRALKLSNLL